ncbi:MULTISPECIES: putative pterin-binding protein [unclassified Rhizobium]|uniref:molybdopterin-dependent oxidoreductase n=1 Tax=unclassified Rhizobium TaxID=2613769 RepID=UPI001AD951F2|nr:MULTISPECIES: molybdopterin-dependent oxidoreductase [unclassified Rhizobium]MBO9102285.1 molybdopterin-dependent oxidoreductase [Rhizobium sp. L58/93]MBO9188109.1 molybdopterin-dependent oxidoreductase [Rhizobium sp. E27B/91]QXZ86348.1 molybdopterin-dependent oxidoreductase [Rhizobium sp. K1/93]QXZ92197.1 molybdopterin-dependent oxidoreductase [Rhizobium sp. K15/93]
MKKICLAILLGSALVVPNFALALDKPRGPVVLTVHGVLTHPNDGKDATFDLPMLEALAGRAATMSTPWTEGKTAFSGPLLSAILEASGANGRALKVTALNDYSAEIPIDDALKVKTILATRMNGKLMSVRDKGPLFLIYPFDTNPELYNEKYFSRSVWQIMKIEIEE